MSLNKSMKKYHFLTIAAVAVSMTVMAESASAVSFLYENDDPAAGNVLEINDLAVDGEISSFNVKFQYSDFVTAFGDPTPTLSPWSGTFTKPYFWSTDQVETARNRAFNGVEAIAAALNTVDEDGDGKSDISLLNFHEYALVPYTYQAAKGQVVSRVAAFNQSNDGLWVPYLTDINNFPSGAILDEENYAEFAPLTPTGEGTPEPASLLGILAVGTSGLLLKNKRKNN